MDFVDPPESEAPSTSIHRGRHNHNDPAGLENPDMINKEDSIQTMKRILISIWSPYARFLLKWYREDQELQVRLKRSDQVVQKVIQGNEEDMGSTAVSNLNILKSLYHGMFEIDDLRKNSYAITSPSSSSSSVFAGEVVSLMESVLQNLNDTFIFLADNTSTSSPTIILHAKEEQVEGLKERLIFFRNFLWLIPNPLLINYQDCVCVFDGAQMIALTIPPFLYVVVCSINDEELTWELGDAFRLLLAGLFIFKFSDKTEDEQIANYCCLKTPDLLKAVDDTKQKASDLFNDYFFSSRKSLQSSNCPSNTNVLEYVNFIISKLEKQFCSKADPINALKRHMENAYEQLVSMRKLLCDIAQHLGNSHMEFLLTRFKDAAYQAEYIIDSYVAGEGLIWGHKLGLFVVIKDVKILYKELKAAFLTMTMACDTVIPTISSSAPSQANYHVKGGSKGEIHNKYKFLRVLDLGNAWIRCSADASDLLNITELVHLRCLAIRLLTDEIPSEIGNLQNLETFFITGVFLPVKLVKLPEAIWTLASSSATDSINQIVEEQRDMSNDQLNVTFVCMV
ncbi:hypothetical protein ACH5RR_002955 [Cinchona calisaya]|uniref:Disease resistance R13L4/SHOC-2-like LRR domain-containing protein n=1 Tax=Cinchona calisaya TaxID=153742 RepID=A0ABD3ATG0_9GENT